MAQGEISVSNQSSGCSPPLVGRGTPPPKPPSIQCRKVVGQPPHRVELSSFLPHGLTFMHVYYWVPRPAFVHIGSYAVFILGSQESSGTLLPRVLVFSAHGVEAGDIRTSPCLVHRVTCASLQKKLILSPRVELSLTCGRAAAGLLPAVCLWVGRFGLGACVQHQSPLFPSCSGLCVNFSPNPLWDLLVETVFHPH